MNLFFVSKGDTSHSLGFAEVYKDCFSQSPYFESYDVQWIVEKVYRRHLDHGCVVLAKDDAGSVLGLGCAEPVHCKMEGSVYEFLSVYPNLPFNLDNSIYIAELAVVSGARRRGLGTELVRKMIEWSRLHRIPYYTARTAHQGSNSLGLFLRLGAIVLDKSQDIFGARGEIIKSQSQNRIYLWGNC